MLSVDSGGNFRYYSGTGDKKTMRGFEYLPREIMQTNASILTDRFTSLTADKIVPSTSSEKSNTTIVGTDKKVLPNFLNIADESAKKSYAAFDIISAFEALPERADSQIP